MMDLLKLIDNTNYEHSRQVSEISKLMAKKAGYSQAESRIIAQAALYHDIGKVAIPPCILNKPASLTPDEYEIVKTHAAVGCKQITEAVQVLTIAAIIAQQHHEYQNGCGYYRLSGDDIHPYAKLVAVADVFDALYSKRAYKKAWNMRKIREHFTEQTGKQFDAEMVSLIFSIIKDVLELYKNHER